MLELKRLEISPSSPSSSIYHVYLTKLHLKMFDVFGRYLNTESLSPEQEVEFLSCHNFCKRNSF